MKFQDAIVQNPDIVKSLEFDKYLLQVPVEECGEDFCSLVDLASEKVVQLAFDSDKNKLFYLRKGVAFAVLDAAAILEKQGHILKVEYAYRSLSQQKTMFLERVEETKKKYPGLSEQEALQISNIYTAGIPILGAHTAGAAVDVTLLRATDQQPIDMGCPYLHGGPESGTSYPNISEEAKGYRKLLVSVMENCGLVNYPFEYWHFSKGDVCAAHVKKQLFAIYAPVDLDKATGELQVLPPDKYRIFFNM